MGNVIKNGNYCVYVHTSPSGKMYVGQTGLKPEYRWGSDGKRYLEVKKNGDYLQPAFARAILKYGWDSFEHQIIASNLTKEEADNFEKLLIKKLNTMDSKYGYNLREGGSNGALSKETRRRISESTKGEKSHMYGKHLNESTKKKISDFRKGVLASEETKRKMSESRKGENNYFYGKHHTEESRRKISESQKGLRMGKNHIGARRVKQYDLQGNLLKIWDCMSDAGRELGISNHNIYNCCKDNRKTSGGFIWRYFEDEITNEYLAWCNESPPDKYSKKCVAQYSLSGELICIFESMAEAELQTGVSHSGISKCCRKERNQTGGFIWRYYENEEREVS